MVIENVYTLRQDINSLPKCTTKLPFQSQYNIYTLYFSFILIFLYRWLWSHLFLTLCWIVAAIFCLLNKWNPSHSLTCKCKTEQWCLSLPDCKGERLTGLFFFSFSEVMAVASPTAYIRAKAECYFKGHFLSALCTTKPVKTTPRVSHSVIL